MTVSAMPATCPQWVALMNDYRRAVREYGDAVDQEWEASELARKKCEDLRDALMAHEYAHGCVCA